MKKVGRVLVAVGVPLSLATLLVVCLFLGKTPPCLFYEATGLYCFGCGSGRAMLALLRGDLALAFRNQPLLLVALPFLCYAGGSFYLSFVTGRPLLSLPRIQNRAFGVIVVVVLVAFMVLRNIPLFPFTYLAPIPPA